MTNSFKLVTVDGECFEAAFQRKEVAANRDGVFYLFHITDLKKSRGTRLVSLFRSGPAKLGIQNYDTRIETVRLNAIRRALDSRALSFDAPNDEHTYKEYLLDTPDFQEQPLRNDQEIRRYIIHKAYWLSYRYPTEAMRSDVVYPIQFDEPIDLDYLGASSPDVRRNLQRLGSQGLLERIMEGLGRPSEKLLSAYESGDFASLGIAEQGPSLSIRALPVSDDYKFARLAIEEARKSVSEQDGRPHPKVGAVVVKDGQVLSSAHRGEAIGNHAEFIALEKKLSDSAVAGATVYTTLEPCTTRNHPKIPCAERLIERKVSRVVIGMLDPDPRITGRGQRRLRAANIVTDFFPHDLMTEVEELNREFTRHHETQGQTPQPSPMRDERLEQLKQFAEEKKRVLVQPVIPAQFENPFFQVRELNANTVVLEKSSSNHVIGIPSSRVTEILTAPSEAPTLMLNGRLQWITMQKEWRFVPEPPPTAEDGFLGCARIVGGLQDPYVREIEQQLPPQYEGHWFRREKLPTGGREWLPFYGSDGRYLVIRNNREALILAVRFVVR